MADEEYSEQFKKELQKDGLVAKGPYLDVSDSFVKGKSLKYYIEKAGGYSQRAKRSKAYVVYMNGSVAKAKKRSSKLVQPGCEIVVPARQEREGLKATEILSLGSTSASLATVVLALMNLVK